MARGDSEAALDHGGLVVQRADTKIVPVDMTVGVLVGFEREVARLQGKGVLHAVALPRAVGFVALVGERLEPCHPALEHVARGAGVTGAEHECGGQRWQLSVGAEERQKIIRERRRVDRPLIEERRPEEARLIGVGLEADGRIQRQPICAEQRRAQRGSGHPQCVESRLAAQAGMCPPHRFRLDTSLERRRADAERLPRTILSVRSGAERVDLRATDVERDLERGAGILALEFVELPLPRQQP